MMFTTVVFSLAEFIALIQCEQNVAEEERKHVLSEYAKTYGCSYANYLPAHRGKL